MCGLAGIASNIIYKKHHDIFYQLMLTAQLRGQHSAGFASLFMDQSNGYKNRFPNYDYDKCTGTPESLFSRRKTETLLTKSNNRALIGHCRSATRGDVRQGNAHPFDTGNLIGVHNGTIRSEQLNQDKYHTDSECLFNNIDDLGVRATIENTVGAWALIWYNGVEEKLHFLRNTERTLYFVIEDHPHDETMYWASEIGQLHWILNRNGIKFDRDKYPAALPPNRHVTFKLFEDNWLATMETEEIIGKEAPVNNSAIPFQQELNGGANGSSEKAAESQTKKEIIKTQPKTQPSHLNSASAHPTVIGTKIRLNHKGFNGVLISKERHQEILEKGCALCTEISPINRPHRFVAKEKYVCEDCMQEIDSNPEWKELFDQQMEITQ